MHFSIVLLIVTISVGYAYAISCPPEFCDSANCVNEMDTNGLCSGGTVKMPTFCGCCTRCVVPIGRGQRCSMAIGVPQHPCEDGYACFKGICKAIL